MSAHLAIVDVGSFLEDELDLALRVGAVTREDAARPVLDAEDHAEGKPDGDSEEHPAGLDSQRREYPTEADRQRVVAVPGQHSADADNRDGSDRVEDDVESAALYAAEGVYNHVPALPNTSRDGEDRGPNEGQLCDFGRPGG
nr:hypothetical protein [Corynebacterium crudilactis]